MLYTEFGLRVMNRSLVLGTFETGRENVKYTVGYAREGLAGDKFMSHLVIIKVMWY